MKKIMLFTFFLTVVSPSIASQKTNNIKLLNEKPQGQCKFNSILPSNKDVEFAIYRSNQRFQDAPRLNQPDSFVIYSMQSYNQKAKSSSGLKPTILGGIPARLRPLAWVDGKLTFRVGPSAIGQMSPNLSPEIQIHELPEVWSDYEIHVNDGKHLNLLYNEDLLTRADEIASSPYNIRKTLYISEEGFFSVIKRGEGQSLKVGTHQDSLESLGPASFFYNFSINLSKDRVTYYFLGGEIDKLKIVKANYQRPIFNFSSGLVEGSFTPNSFNLVGHEIKTGEIFENQRTLFRDVSVNNANIFLLIQDYDKISVVILDRISRKKIHQIEICEFDGALRTLFPTLPIKTMSEHGPTSVDIGLRLGPKVDTTGILLKRKKNPSDRLVLFYHGGPAQTSNPYDLGLEKLALLEDNLDILFIEYSGSVGGGIDLSKNLSSSDGFGFMKDAQALKQWLRTQRYKRVDLYAVSFGTLPALVFSKTFPNSVDRRVFVGPLLNYGQVEEIENDATLLENTIRGGQLDFEIGIFGSSKNRKEYLSFIRELTDSYLSDKDDLFVFGGSDKKTPIHLAPEHIIKKARILEVKNTPHDFLPGNRQTISGVRCHFDIVCSSSER